MTDAHGALQIEMVLPALVAGGMEVMVANMVRHLAGAGHGVGVTCTDGLGLVAEQLRAAGVRVRHVPAPGLRGNVWPAALARALRQGGGPSERRPDVVHIHSGAWLRGARAARMAGVRTVVHTVHGIFEQEPWFDVPLKRASAACTDHVVAVSEPLRTHLTRRIGIPPGRVRVIPNGVDTARFAPARGADAAAARARTRASLGVPAGAPLVGILARLEPIKNPGLLLEAFRLAAPRVPDAHLALVGDGAERGALEARAAALAAAEPALAGRVHFAGVRLDTPDVYRALDVAALTSNAEGAPMAVIEAMATGLAFVSTDVGGIRDQLGDGGCGVLTPAGDAPALADALARLLADPAERAALGRRARARAEAHFSLEAMMRAYEQLYRARAGAAAAAAA